MMTTFGKLPVGGRFRFYERGTVGPVVFTKTREGWYNMGPGTGDEYEAKSTRVMRHRHSDPGYALRQRWL